MGLKTGAAIAVLLAIAVALTFWPEQKASSPSTSTDRTNQAIPQTSLQGSFTLAVSWHPAFCETARRKPECQNELADGFAANNFVLHGLWPDGADAFYCNVPTAIANHDRNGQWRQLPAIALSDALWGALQQKMPGTQSQLHRHEWVKHGTCSNGSAEDYFAASLALLDALNKSPIREIFANNIGKRLSADAIRNAFNGAFGASAGLRVTVECARQGGRTMIDELRIAISGPITTPTALPKLIAAGTIKDRGCPSGEIDRAG